MIKSMTSFAKEQMQDDNGIISWELRSVNNRFLDIHFRLPEAFRELELKLRDLVKKHLNRGKVDGNLQFQAGPASSSKLEVNTAMLQQLKGAVATLESNMDAVAPVDPIAMLRWPGVLQTQEEDLSAVKAAVLDVFEKALVEMNASRDREGVKLAELIETRLTDITKHVETVRKALPDILSAQRQKIVDRIEEAKVELDPERLEQEMVYIMQKSDVAEELDRLETHVAEMQRTLKEGGTVGRRLDFLTQEMHREANTLGSKSISDETTQASMALKVLIEQIREQVQNIE